MNEKDLFSSRKEESAEPLGIPIQEISWYLPTNQLNLAFMLGADLIFGPAGFGKKYYQDALENCRGWIPLFANQVPKTMLEKAVSEEGYLRSVIVELGLGEISGDVRQISSGGVLSEVSIPGKVDDCAVLLLPAPLPSRRIKSIFFPNVQEKNKFISECIDYGNISLDDYSLKTKKTLFEKPSDFSWDPKVFEELPDVSNDLTACGAVGGAMALLHALANRGDSSVEAAQVFFNTPQEKTADDSQPSQGTSLDPKLVSVFCKWADQSVDEPMEDTQGRLLLSVLAAIVCARTPTNDDASIGLPDVYTVVLDELESEQRSLQKENWQEALDRLRRDLKNVQGLGKDTASELLNRHTKPFSRSLLMFFLRERPEEIWDFYNNSLNPEDLSVAALLFGARSGWEGLSSEFLERKGIRRCISHRMAALAQHKTGIGLELGDAPQREGALRELIQQTSSEKFNKKQIEALSKLAGKMGWNKVISTKVSFPKGSYEFVIEGGSLHVILEGAKDITQTLINDDTLLDHLANERVEAGLEDEVRETFLS